MRGVFCAVTTVALLVAPSIATAGRVAFDRIHPAPRNLGSGTEMALIYAIGDSQSITTFIDVFLYETNHAGTLRVYDARSSRRGRPNAVPLRVTEFRCTTKNRSGEGSTRDFEGNRVRRRHMFADAVCEARLELARGTNTESFRVRGEGTSPRVDQLTPEEIEIAVHQAARYAAISAAEEITPRRVREIIVLDDAAPGFAEIASMVDADRLDEAGRAMQAMLSRHPRSAPLRFNLAAVSEALGDVRAAGQHYEAARELAPQEKRYRTELELFRRRNGLK